MDGFIISHSIESMQYIADEDVKKFVGEYIAIDPLLDIDNPKSIGALVLTDYYMEHKRAQHEAMINAKKVIQDVSAEFAKLFGRNYELFETYRLEDAEVVLVALNSAAGTIKDEVDRYREKGVKAGLLKPRVFRPFPYEEVGAALRNAKAVCVMDRADSYGGFGPLFMEIASASRAAQGPRAVQQDLRPRRQGPDAARCGPGDRRDLRCEDRQSRGSVRSRPARIEDARTDYLQVR